MTNESPPSFRILRRPEVERLVGLSRSSIYAMMAKGEFPRPICLSRRAVGWRQTDIDEWLNCRPLAVRNQL
ncbi:AlpA family phage regulatory protein [Altererythrobacter salegens]|uniref:AlpA family phage regulatory protein n=1 Tax=Croceibacterium salegens TaxID=1737568 RepID=A0A6I4SQT1_9SPHN|nr:AlpA family transcriptional regulator [Croceibacterium salegens]MXO58165.1 AlpA family phage regulatory protein [Croceibacterium salegens]